MVGEAGAEVLPLVDRHAPDVVLMDIRMPAMDGLAATEVLRARRVAPQIIVVTTFDADRHVLRAEIVTAVRQVAQGQPVLSPAVTKRLIARVAETGADARRTGPLPGSRC